MFRLLRYFSIASLILMVLATVLIGTLHRLFEKSDLLKFGESHSVTLTQTFANVIWPQFRSFAVTAGQLDADALRHHPDIPRLNKDVREGMRNTDLLKLNIFQLDGRALFSTDASHIGTDESRNGAFLAARQGRAISTLTHYDKINALDGEIVNRDVLESYVPLRRNADAPIEGVLEMYTDVTG